MYSCLFVSDIVSYIEAKWLYEYIMTHDYFDMKEPHAQTRGLCLNAVTQCIAKFRLRTIWYLPWTVMAVTVWNLLYIKA